MDRTGCNVAHCNAFFDRLQPSSWSYNAFVTHCSKAGVLEVSLLNSRYLRALLNIRNSHAPGTEEANKAQSLIAKHHAKFPRRQKSVEIVFNGDVVQGDVIQGDKIAGDKIAGDKIGVEEIRKRPRRDSSPERPIDKRPAHAPAPTDETGETANAHTPTPAAEDTSLAYTRFVASHQAMKTRTPFSSTQRLLQDVIREKVDAMTPESRRGNPILRWILDLDAVGGWFSDEELAELRSWTPPQPKADESYFYARRRFSEATTAQAIRHVAETSPRPAHEVYDRSKNFNATYVNAAAGSVLSMIESLGSRASWLGPQALREGWFGHNLWGPIVDGGLNSLLLSRTEIKAKSDPDCNKRYDAIISTLAGAKVCEFGAIEVARTSDTIAPDKPETDNIKLVNALHSMLRQLHKDVRHDPEIVSQLEVVGIQHIGFTIRILRMSLVGGNVFLLRAGNPRTVPTTIEEFSNVFEIMQAIVVTKQILERSAAVITRYYDAKKTGEFEL